MPSRSGNYGVPQWNPDGSTDINQAMQAWTGQFGQQYQTGQEDAERLPFIISTYTTNAGTVNGILVAKEVQLMGGEQVQVTGFFDFSCGSSASTGNSRGERALGKLVVSYPGGTTSTVSSGGARVARLETSQFVQPASTFTNTSFNIRINVSHTWPVTPRKQTGGRHRFSLRTTDGGGNGGQVHGGTLQILVL